MTDRRLLRGIHLAARPQNFLPLSPGLFRVASQSGAGSYTLRLDGTNFLCDCPDFKGRRRSCKHIYGLVEFLAISAGVPLHAPEDPAAAPRKKTYPQDWPAYDAAQQAEHPLFDPLLWDLLESIPETLKPVGSVGRPRLPLRSLVFQAVKKVQAGESCRRARGLLLTTHGGGIGPLDYVPSYNRPSYVFCQPSTAPLLLALLTQSALPLAELEDGGTVAVDSTGFCTTCRGAYCSETHLPGRTHRWVKAHLVIGVKTHIILSARITEENGADAVQFLPLLNDTRAAGFTPAEVVADKAYCSRENYDGSQTLGLDPYLPFRSNMASRSEGCRLWKEKYHQFQLRREEFDAHYHQRSNVEAVISAVKRKLGEPLLSKTQTARFNELLAKLLVYNIGVVIHEMFEHHIDPGVPGLRLPGIPSENS